MVRKIGEIMVPMLIHFLAGNLVVMFLGVYLDSAALTAIAGILTFPVIYLMYQKGEGKMQKERHRVPAWSYVFAAVLGVIANQFISLLMGIFHITDNLSSAAQDKLFQSHYIIQLVSLGIIAPIVEEVIFRGLIYQRMKKYLPIRIAALLSALIFAIYHGNLLQMIFAFPMALIIIICYERWNSLAIPIVFHAAGNLFAVLQKF